MSFLSGNLVSGPSRGLDRVLRISIQVLYRGFWPSGLGPRNYQLGNNCHTDRNSQIKKFFNLLGPPPFYKAHDKKRAVTGIIFQALPGQTDRQIL
jgi:hypothetical protein